MERSTENALIYGGGTLLLFGAYLWWKKTREAREPLPSIYVAPPAALPSAVQQVPMVGPSAQDLQRQAEASKAQKAARNAILPNMWGTRLEVTKPFRVFYDDGSDYGQPVGYNYLLGIQNPYDVLVFSNQLPKIAKFVGDTSAIEKAGPQPLATMQKMVSDFLTENGLA